MTRDICSAHSRKSSAREAATELLSQLSGLEPVALLFFASHRHDGSALARALREAFPRAQVIGCTTAGELTQSVSCTDSVSLLALGKGKVRRAAAALARFQGGVAEGIAAATAQLASQLDLDLRAADPQRYVGITLIEGLRMHEEAANEALGNSAPLLSFVGGSAADNGQFQTTRVYCNGEESDDGAVLLLLDAAVPFAIGKTCSFVPHSRALAVTRADAQSRVLYELDSRPACEVYAEVLGKRPEQLGNDVFMENPLGLMIEGQPWIRSPMQVLPDGGLKFYCQLVEGSEIHVMQSTDLVSDTRRELLRVASVLGSAPSGGLVFNCYLRRLELDKKALHEPFIAAFAGQQMAGFHTYGESWLAHINQTLTGLWFK